jgi:hypothetical protein
MVEEAAFVAVRTAGTVNTATPFDTNTPSNVIAPDTLSDWAETILSASAAGCDLVKLIGRMVAFPHNHIEKRGPKPPRHYGVRLAYRPM